MTHRHTPIHGAHPPSIFSSTTTFFRSFSVLSMAFFFLASGVIVIIHFMTRGFKRIWPFDDEPGVSADRVVGAEQEQGRRPRGRVRLLMVMVVVMVMGSWSPHAGGCTRRPDAVTSRGRRDFFLCRQPGNTKKKTQPSVKCRPHRIKIRFFIYIHNDNNTNCQFHYLDDDGIYYIKM